MEPLGWTFWLEIAIMCAQRRIVAVNYTQWIYMLINMPFYFMSYLWEPCFKYNTIIFWRQYRLHISLHPHTLSLCHTHMYAAILSPRWNFFSSSSISRVKLFITNAYVCDIDVNYIRKSFWLLSFIICFILFDLDLVHISTHVLSWYV